MGEWWNGLHNALKMRPSKRLRVRVPPRLPKRRIKMKFSEMKLGLFRYRGLVYSKISDTQAVLITMGKIVEFAPDDEVENY